MEKNQKKRVSGTKTSVGAPSRIARAPKKPLMTDAERHQRFVDMAHEIQASDNPDDFDKAFEKVMRDQSSG